MIIIQRIDCFLSPKKFNFLETSSFFFSKVPKFNVSLIYKAIIVIFSVSLPMVNIQYIQVLQKKNWSNHLENLENNIKVTFDPKSLSYTKFHKKKNDRKGQYTLAHFREKCEKVRNEDTGTEKRSFWLIYLKTFKKMTWVLLLQF